MFFRGAYIAESCGDRLALAACEKSDQLIASFRCLSQARSVACDWNSAAVAAMSQRRLVVRYGVAVDRRWE